MLGLILIYFIGKAFFDLAGEYNKSEWGFAILGIISYYFGTFIGGIILVMIGTFTGSDFFETSHRIILSLLSMPFGLLVCWIFYRILSSEWKYKSGKNSVGDDVSLR